jgi:hypothetical protein
MQMRHLIPVLALLVGCPSPPDDAKAGPGGGGPPKAPPKAAKADAGGGAGGGPPGAPKDGAPPADGAAPPADGAAPPADGAGGPGGEGKPPGTPGSGGGGKGAPPPDGDGPQPEPAVGYGPGHNDQNPGGRSIVSSVAETQSKVDDGDIDQETVRKMEPGTFSVFRGEAKCSGCSGDLILRAIPYFAPDGKPPKDVPSVLTHMTLDGAGAFEFAVPDRDVTVVLELLVDKNKDGKATKGERFAMLESRGGLSAKKPMSGLVIDASTSAAKLDSTDPLVPGEPIKPQDANEQK